jgi:hypothetical protein
MVPMGTLDPDIIRRIYETSIKAVTDAPSTSQQAILAALNALREDEKDKAAQTIARRRELRDLLLEKDEQYRREFEEIYNKNKRDLQGRQQLERGSGAAATVAGAAAGYKFASLLIQIVKAVTGNGITLTYALLLSIVKVLQYIPFLYSVTAWFDTSCLETEGLFGNVYAAQVPSGKEKLVYSYDWYGYDPKTGTFGHHTASNQPTCPGQFYDAAAWTSWQRTSDCTATTVPGGTVLECQGYNGVDLKGVFGMGIEATTATIGALFAGLGVYYLVKIVTQQTQLLPPERASARGVLGSIKQTASSTGKMLFTLSGVGAIIQIIQRSEERLTLVDMVNNNKISVDGNLLKLEEYVLRQSKIFESTDMYITAKASVTRAEEEETEARKRATEAAQRNLDILQQQSGASQATVLALTNGAFDALSNQPQAGGGGYTSPYGMLQAPPGHAGYIQYPGYGQGMLLQAPQGMQVNQQHAIMPPQEPGGNPNGNPNGGRKLKSRKHRKSRKAKRRVTKKNHYRRKK